jgi:hypothetical protein
MLEYVAILTCSVYLVYNVFYLLGCCTVSISGLIPMFCSGVFVLPSRVKRSEDGINMLSQMLATNYSLTLHNNPLHKNSKLHDCKGLKSCITFWCQLYAADSNNIHTSYSVHCSIICYRLHQHGILKCRQQTTHWHSATSHKIINPILHHENGLISFVPLKCKF